MPISLKFYWSLLKTYLKPFWLQILLLFIFLISNICLLTISPLIIEYFVSFAVKDARNAILIDIAFLFLILSLIQPLMSLVEVYLAENISLQATNRLRSDLMSYCLRQNMTFYGMHSPGELIERVDGDVGRLTNFFSRFVITLLGDFFLLAGIIFVLFMLNFWVGFVVMLFTIIAVFILFRLQKTAIPHWQSALQSRSHLFGILEEYLSGVDDIRANGASQYAIKRFLEASRVMLQKYIVALQMLFLNRGMMRFLLATGSASALAVSIYLLTKNIVSIATVYAIYYYTTLLNTPVEQLIEQTRDLQQSTVSIIRIYELFSENHTIDDKGVINVNAQDFSLEFQNVSFGYKNDLHVLNDISFKVPSGSVLGIVGRTGSGKSTIIKLLTRLYDPQVGKIIMGNIDLRELSLDGLRRNIGVVTQEISIFGATVRDNITLFDTNVDDNKIRQALKDVGLEQWYNALPNGLNTKLIPSESGLSAGEAQLLSIARILLRNPCLVILDEASSRLDLVTEALFKLAIDRFLERKCTIIIIAHRFSAIEEVDLVMVLENGHCIEFGERKVLALNTGSYFSQQLRASHSKEVQ